MCPNLSLKGAEREEGFVVAPMMVNFGRSRRMVRAPGPLPRMMSRRKSSMAE